MRRFLRCTERSRTRSLRSRALMSVTEFSPKALYSYTPIVLRLRYSDFPSPLRGSPFSLRTILPLGPGRSLRHDPLWISWEQTAHADVGQA